MINRRSSATGEIVSKVISLEAFEIALRMQFQQAAEEIAEEEIRQAKMKIEQRMRDLLSKTVMQISNWYSVEFQENKVVIEVKQHI
jgi:dsDNA-specific endonuclease/ATPase MutS2